MESDWANFYFLRYFPHYWLVEPVNDNDKFYSEYVEYETHPFDVKDYQ